MANPPKLPPKLTEGRSDARETLRLINAMRSQMEAGGISGGSGQFSTRFSDDGLGSSLGTPEVVGQVETPAVLETFAVQFGAQAQSDGGDGVIQIVIGGGDWTPDGTVLASVSVPSGGLARVVFPVDGDPVVIYTNTPRDTRIKLVLTGPAPGQYVKAWDHALVLV